MATRASIRSSDRRALIRAVVAPFAFSTPAALPLSRTRKTLVLRRVLDAAPDSARSLITIKGGGMSLLLPVRGAR